MNPKVAMFLSKQHFKINERSVSIRRAPNFAEAAFAVKFARARIAIESIQSNRVGRPFFRDPPRFVDAQPSDALALLIRRDRHRRQVQWLLARAEIPPVDRPRFALRKS